MTTVGNMHDRDGLEGVYIGRLSHRDGLEGVYIGRLSPWGNPFKIGRDGTRDEVIRKYRDWLLDQPDLIARAKRELKGKRLLCFCFPLPCHGDVLAQVVDTP